jgi:hypothetical protein
MKESYVQFTHGHISADYIRCSNGGDTSGGPSDIQISTLGGRTVGRHSILRRRRRIMRRRRVVAAVSYAGLVPIRSTAWPLSGNRLTKSLSVV